MSNPNTQIMDTMGVSVTSSGDGRIELFQCNTEETSTITITEDEARLLVERLGNYFGLKISTVEGAR